MRLGGQDKIESLGRRRAFSFVVGIVEACGAEGVGQALT
jgi:hypothetical protein